MAATDVEGVAAVVEEDGDEVTVTTQSADRVDVEWCAVGGLSHTTLAGSVVEGVEVDEQLELVFERFNVVWPESLAD